MDTTVSNKPHALIWIAGIAVTLFSAVGIAAIMGWLPTSIGSYSDETAQAKLESTERKTAKPAERRAAAAKPAAANAPVKPTPAPTQVASAVPVAKAICRECGVIESVRGVDTPGEATGLGAVGGAVVGGVLGNQVGGGSGKKIATVAGAVGGAVAGHQIEKYAKKETRYEITVRMEDGSSRMIHASTSPTWRTGDRVKITDGVLQSNS